MPARPRVLVIDDSALILEVTRSALEEAGFDVDVAADVSAFEQRRAANAPDVIVVDVQMPEVFGDDLAAMLRGAYGVHIPILLLSSLPEAQLAERARAADVWGYVTKGEGLDALVGRVREALASAGGA
jgi:CheY-like chemotaxis protein